jgi:DNA-binding transcriptional LysR family regulator
VEKTLGARLVERSTDGWELTETGRAVAEEACPIQEAPAAGRLYTERLDSLVQVGDLDATKPAPGMTTRFASTNILAQLEATRVGAGIGLLPKFLAVHVGQRPLRLALTLAARRDSSTRPAVQVVREALHEEVRARRAELA